MRLRLPPVRLWVTTLSVGFLLGGPEQADLMPYPLQCSPLPPSCRHPCPQNRSRELLESQVADGSL